VHPPRLGRAAGPSFRSKQLSLRTLLCPSTCCPPRLLCLVLCSRSHDGGHPQAAVGGRAVGRRQHRALLRLHGRRGSARVCLCAASSRPAFAAGACALACARAEPARLARLADPGRPACAARRRRLFTGLPSCSGRSGRALAEFRHGLNVATYPCGQASERRMARQSRA